VRQVHVITAFSRWQNLPFYLVNLEKLNVLWHPIVDQPHTEMEHLWIEPYYCHNRAEGGDVFYRRLNAWIEEAQIEDDDYYIFLNDDDWMAENVPSLLATYDDDVVFAGMLRGNHPVPGHPITPLMPFRGVGAGSIGVEQIILKGKILKTVRFNVNSGMADGILAETLQTQYGIRYAPELVMYFNYLEQGRW
jgi:hypothetical protein